MVSLVKKFIIRSSSSSLKNSNLGKIEKLCEFLNEYFRVMQCTVDFYWGKTNLRLPRMADADFIDSIETTLSARATQCAAKQALAIVLGTIRKNKRREFIANKLEELGQLRKAKNLRDIIERNPLSKPTIKGTFAELDSRFVDINLESTNSFDCWVTLSSLGQKLKLTLPVKKTRHFNKMLSENYKLKSGIRISENEITFLFYKEKPEKKILKTNILGIDIGKLNLLNCSNGFQSNKNEHGHDLNSILNKMSRQKRGSKAFNRSKSHRLNYINWSINKLNLEEFSQVNIEKIRNLRVGKRSSSILAHWTYGEIFGSLKNYCEKLGVPVIEVNPTYTSQRCSHCGWTHKRNRNGKLFKCSSCGFTADSDLNASVNISLELPYISRGQRLSKPNKEGFYWVYKGQENIVPAVKKLLRDKCP